MNKLILNRVFIILLIIFQFGNFNASFAQSCGTPVGLNAVSITSSAATIKWRNMNTANSYNFRFREQSTVNWNTGTSSNTSQGLTGLNSTTTYEFQVQAVCASGAGSFSASGTFTTKAAGSCGVPSGLNASSITTTGALLAWNAVSGAISYTVQYSISGSSTWTSATVSSNSYVVSGLTASTVYVFQVQTTCSGSSSAFSPSSSFTTSSLLCEVPKGVQVSGITSSSVTLSWTPVVGANGYTVQYRISGSANWITTTVTTTSIGLTGLTSGTTYEYQVSTICSGSSSAYSTIQAFTTTSITVCNTPSASTFYVTNISSTIATVNWTAVSGVIGYNVQYRISGGTSWSSVYVTTNLANLSGLNASTVYEFQVQSVCSGGTSSFSSSGIFQTYAATSCAVPDVASFSSTLITSSSCTIGWSAVTGAISYNVQYRVQGSGGAWTTVSTTTNSKALTGLSASTLYEFQVQTVCSSGSSTFSSSGIFTTAATPCGISSGLNATSITYNSATLNWTAVSGALSYVIQYRLVGATVWISTTSTTNSKAISGLTASAQYEFQVQTVCSSGSSTFSSSGIFTTAATPCGISSGLNATSITYNSATLNWTAVSGALSYVIQYRLVGATVWISTTSTTNSKAISGLTASAQYEFQVQTVCSSGSSAFTSSTTFTTAAATCGITSGLNVTTITSSSAMLLWNAISGALSYNIQYKLTTASVWTNTTSLTNSKGISGLTPFSDYEFKVQTVCNAASSVFTSSVIFITNASPTLPVPDHIVVVIFENHAYSQIIGNSAAPNINALATDAMSASFTQSYAIEHPSQPNYLDIFAGSNQGVTNNNVPPAHFNTMNLSYALQLAGRSHVSYSEGLPSVGWDGAASGYYVRKHNPVANWMGTGVNQVSATQNQPLTAFPTDYNLLPTVSFVLPDLLSSMHDGTGNAAITTGDTWFYNKLNNYVQWARTHNSMLILTFDEDDNSSNNQIVTIINGPMVKQGQYSTTINHFNVLRTIEDMYGLVHSGTAATAAPIRGCWKNGYRIAASIAQPPSALTDLNLVVYPNPVKDEFHVHYTLDNASSVSIKLYNLTGQTMLHTDATDQSAGTYEWTYPVSEFHLNEGMYFLEVIVNGNRQLYRIVIGN